MERQIAEHFDNPSSGLPAGIALMTGTPAAALAEEWVSRRFFLR
jgi:hypothetical protein